MRRLGWLVLVVVALLSFLGGRSYHPRVAISYANRHWRDARAGHRLGRVYRGNRNVLARQVPSSGWFQPDYQCAEFVGRSLHAGGIPIPEVAPSNPRWPTLVNVDRQSVFLLSHGWAQSNPKTALKPGDVVLFGYIRPGHAKSPTLWSHMALVVHVHPTLLDAHNAAQYRISLHKLEKGSFKRRDLSILESPRLPRVPESFHAGSVVAIRWRDVHTSRGEHLYAGEVFPIGSHSRYRVTLEGVPGTVSPSALAAVGPLPLTASHRVIVGLTPSGRALLSDAREVPEWTGHPHITTARLRTPYHLLKSPTPVKAIRHTTLRMLPSRRSPALAYVPQGSATVADATITWRHHQWVEVEWWGPRLGIGYILASRLVVLDTPHLTLPKSLGPLITKGGRSLMLPRGMTLALSNQQIFYAGALLPMPRTLRRLQASHGAR